MLSNRVEAIRNLLSSPLWLEILEPLLDKEIKKRSEEVLRGDLAQRNEDIARGRVAALRYFKKQLKDEISEYEKRLARQAPNPATKRHEHHAKQGFRSPYPLEDN